MLIARYLSALMLPLLWATLAHAQVRANQFWDGTRLEISQRGSLAGSIYRPPRAPEDPTDSYTEYWALYRNYRVPTATSTLSTEFKVTKKQVSSLTEFIAGLPSSKVARYITVDCEETTSLREFMASGVKADQVSTGTGYVVHQNGIVAGHLFRPPNDANYDDEFYREYWVLRKNYRYPSASSKKTNPVTTLTPMGRFKSLRSFLAKAGTARAQKYVSSFVLESSEAFDVE